MWMQSVWWQQSGRISRGDKEPVFGAWTLSSHRVWRCDAITGRLWRMSGLFGSIVQWKWEIFNNGAATLSRVHFYGYVISGNQEMSGNLTKVKEKAQSQGKVMERSGNVFSPGNLIVAAQQNNLPVLYSYCNSFFIRDVHDELGLINVHLFDIMPAISSSKVGIFLSGEC